MVAKEKNRKKGIERKESKKKERKNNFVIHV